MIIVKDAQQNHVKKSVEIALKEYNMELSKCSQLMSCSFEKELEELIKEMFESNYSKVAFENDELVGYLAFFEPWNGFFGEVKGTFSPLGASGFTGNDRGKTASILFEELGQKMMEDGVFSFALSRYASDDEVGRALVLNGFGIRCSDAILKLSDRKIIRAANNEYELVELINKEKELIENLRQQLVYHIAHAPTFFPTSLRQFDEWFKQDNIRIFAAKHKKKIIGYMSIDTDAETFVSEKPNIKNICGAFIDKGYRGTQLAANLLEFVCDICEKEGMEYIGVDCETLNPTALRFWNKYFAPYTYSYARRLDERVFNYEKYLDSIWKK